MQYECEQVIQKKLGPYEKLIWVGKPKQGIMFVLMISSLFFLVSSGRDL